MVTLFVKTSPNTGLDLPRRRQIEASKWWFWLCDCSRGSRRTQQAQSIVLASLLQRGAIGFQRLANGLP